MERPLTVDTHGHNETICSVGPGPASAANGSGAGIGVCVIPAAAGKPSMAHDATRQNMPYRALTTDLAVDTGAHWDPVSIAPGPAGRTGTAENGAGRRFVAGPWAVR